MKTKKIVAKDTKRALQLATEEFGEDAVLLSSKAVAEGVEIIAADSLPADDDGQEVKITSSQDFLGELNNNFVTLNNLISEQLADIIWEKKEKKNPAQAMCIKHLMKLGFKTDVIDYIVESIDNNSASLENIWQQLLSRMQELLPVVENLANMQNGVYALWGTSGVGKTESVLKIASQYSVKYGADKVAIINTDCDRVAVPERMEIFGKILNVEVAHVENVDDFTLSMKKFTDKELVLIDTPAILPNNQQLTNISSIRDSNNIKNILVLSAKEQISSMNNIFNVIKFSQINGTVITKTDEVQYLGEVISFIIQHKVPLQFVCNGRSVPNDIHYIGDIEMFIKSIVGQGF